ncbi:oxidoreductase [Tumebacillus lacus]|uniref:oxidoreductase n=1 Tax=Tumebacillus lacus TaxID=2995335 RepID=UPI00389AF65D
MAEYTKLMEAAKIGAWQLQSRTAMAPMTRCFADDKTGVISPAVTDYYRRRAADGIGLIITEGIIVDPRGKGNPGVPLLIHAEQAKAWREVTEAVHAEGGTIIAQIWHVGRVTHHEITGGAPLAPSAIRAEGKVSRFGKPYDMPAAMSLSDIREVIGQFAHTAKLAKEAGFDGVEIHGAHGYLIDQFNSDVSNTRDDQYGGDLKQRLTFMKDVLGAVLDVWGDDRTAIRFSALKIDHPTYMWDDPEAALSTFADALRSAGAKIIHPSTMNFTQQIVDGQMMHQLMRKYWKDAIIGVGDLTPETAEQALQAGWIDVAAIGRPLIANPDYLHRVKSGEELVPYDAKTMLGQLV